MPVLKIVVFSIWIRKILGRGLSQYYEKDVKEPFLSPYLLFPPPGFLGAPPIPHSNREEPTAGFPGKNRDSFFYVGSGALHGKRERKRGGGGGGLCYAAATH